MNILIVEDDRGVADAIARAVTEENYGFDICRTAADALDRLGNTTYSAITLAGDLPDSDGFQLAQTLRANGIATPILVVSSRASVADRITALGAGADGYIAAPFDKRELLAWLAAIIRRGAPAATDDAAATIRTGPIALNRGKHEVRVGESYVNLTAKEYEILELLSLSKGSMLSKSRLLEHLYHGGAARGGGSEAKPSASRNNWPNAKIIDVFVCKLRQKLSAAAGGANYIHTIWGQGYVLRDEPSRQEAHTP